MPLDKTPETTLAREGEEGATTTAAPRTRPALVKGTASRPDASRRAFRARGQRDPDGLVFRRPSSRDGAAMYELTRDTGVLDLNSSYAYLMMGEWFSETCVIAEDDGRVVGFVMGFVPPEQPETIFVWQVGVCASQRGKGLGKRLLDRFVQWAPERVRFLEATVTPSNVPSMSLFRAYARHAGAPIDVGEKFAADDFPGEGHEEERLFRIGPVARTENTPEISAVTGTEEKTPMDIFEKHESNVRSYIRSFPDVFVSAKNARIKGESGREYIDFFAGAGALNYGHNDEGMKQKLVDYVMSDGIMHSLDMATAAKGKFIERFCDVILEPRGMDYKLLFPGPTGTNAVETALKLARKVTGRDKVVSFTNAFHGMTLGSLAVTGNAFKRGGAGLPLGNTIFMPYCAYTDEDWDTLSYFEYTLQDGGSGIDLPAACIVETVQGEGGINAASESWLKRLQEICRAHEILLIVDDIQAGCGRTGTFFSFEPFGLEPDIITLSKSLSGFGQPFAMVLVKPEFDVFGPGEHNGTFRGNNLAFVTATEALRFWEDDRLAKDVQRKAAIMTEALAKVRDAHPELHGELRGRGFMQGLAIESGEVADAVCAEAFKNGLILETSGPDGEVVKILAPLTIPDSDLEQGLAILSKAFATVVGKLNERGEKSAA